MGWRQQVRWRKRRRVFAAALATAVLISAWLGLWGAGYFAWVIVFHRTPPEGIAFEVYMALGALLSAAYGRYGVLPPMPGKPTEELAADAFFAGKDVRYDDNAYLPGDLLNESETRK